MVNTIDISSSLGASLHQLESLFCVNQSHEFKELVNFTESRRLPIHRWLNYREGYSPSLVRYYLSTLPENSRVLDPFCGSGTSLVTAKYTHHQAIGIDTNPIAVLSSQVKTHTYSKYDINQITKTIEAILLTKYDAEIPLPGFSSIKKVFDYTVLRDLLNLRERIFAWRSKDSQTVFEFLFLAWISILEPLSYTFKEGNGIKYRKKFAYEDTLILEHPILSLHVPANLVESAFLNKCIQMLQDIEAQIEHAAGDVCVLEGNSIERFQELPGNFNLIIGSPPYANRFDYFEIYKVELWMSGLLSSYSQFREKRKSIIRSNLMTPMLDDSIHEFPELEEFIQFMHPQTATEKKIIVMLRNYFADMKSIIFNSFQKLKPGGKLVLVIGNSAYMNILIPTDLLFAVIAQDAGFSDIKINIARTLTTSSQQRLHLNPHIHFLRESIIEVTK